MPTLFVPSPRGSAAPQPQGIARAEPGAAGLDEPESPVGEAPRGERDHALSPLSPWIDDSRVTDVFVSAALGLFVDRGDGAERDPTWRAAEAEVRDLAVALVGAGGRHLDEATPCVDVRLSRGERVHAVLPPVASAGTMISIRLPLREWPDLAGLAARGFFDRDPARLEWMRGAVRGRANLLISGATGSGKTTLLAAMLAEVPERERIVTIEDVAELRVRHPHHVALEARQPNLEGAGGIGLARLVREALRMRPDRLIVGECRGEEVRELLSALNTGHDGGAGTVHANALADVPARLEALGALAGMDERALGRQAISAIDVVLHVERTGSGSRRLATVGILAMDAEHLTIREVEPWRA